MSRARRIRMAALLTTGTVGVVAIGRNPHARRRVLDTVHRGTRLAHYLEGRLRGACYRASGAVPDPLASDAVVADRVRTRLGRMARALDIPHVHVSVDRHVATLHGDVRSAHDVAEIEESVRAVPGVFRVRSRLHVGLGSGDTPPSVGRLAGLQPSALLRDMLAAAAACDLHDHRASQAVHGVLATLGELLPEGERGHLAAHLPLDVRAMLQPSAHHRRRRPRLRDDGDFLDAAAEHAGVDRMTITPLAEAIAGMLRDRVPEEAEDVAAVLPERLRAWWQVALPA